MPVPSNVGDLNPNPAANSPTGNETVGPNLDDYLRSGFAFTRQIAADFSGDTAPANPFAYMTWADTANGKLKRRNAAGTAWEEEAVLFKLAMTIHSSGAIPTSDIGDILVQGLGRHSWLGGRYVPNNLPTRFRVGGSVSIASTNSVSVASGKWRSVADDSDIILASSMTKVLQSSGSWAAGSGGNGLFNGSAAVSTWYHVFVIRNTSTGAVDVGFDTSVSAANIPNGWSAYRRVGAFFNQSSGGILPFIQEGSRVRFLLPQFNINNTSLLNPVLITVTVPPGVKCLAQVNMVVGTQNATGIAYVYSPDETDRNSAGFGSAFGGNGFLSGGQMDVMTNTASQLFCRASALIPSGVFLTTVAYYDFIGD